MERCSGGKPVVVPKAKEYILARSRSSQRKSYVSILLANGVNGSNNIVRLTKNVSVVRDEENGNRGVEARGSTDATRLSEVEESTAHTATLGYSIAHDIDTCHLSTRIMVYCLNIFSVSIKCANGNSAGISSRMTSMMGSL